MLMEIRDEMAALCCAAMVSTIKTDVDYARAYQLARNMGFSGISEWFAQDSYKQADALLKARASTLGNK